MNWVKTKERLPERNGHYITRDTNYHVQEFCFDNSSPTKWHYLNEVRQKTNNVVLHKESIVEWLDESEAVKRPLTKGEREFLKSLA